MFRNRSFIFALLGLVFALVVWIIPFIYPFAQALDMVHEDHIVENWQFGFLFLGGLCWLVAFFRSKNGWHTHRNVVYLILAMLLFFGAGEEISWGQRVLGFQTPAFMGSNEQGEFTVHNMPEFNSTHAENPFSIRRLFLYFLIIFGTVIPLCALFSAQMRNWFKTIGIPIVPLIMGVQFILYYIMTKLYAPLGIIDATYFGLLPQFRELQEALMLLFIAFNVMLEHLQPVYAPERLPAMAPTSANTMRADSAWNRQ